MNCYCICKFKVVFDTRFVFPSVIKVITLWLVGKGDIYLVVFSKNPTCNSYFTISDIRITFFR